MALRATRWRFPWQQRRIHGLSGVPLDYQDRSTARLSARRRSRDFRSGQFRRPLLRRYRGGPLPLTIIPKDSGFVPRGPGHAYKDNLPAAEIRSPDKFTMPMMDSGNDSQLILGRDLVKSVRSNRPPRSSDRRVRARRARIARWRAGRVARGRAPTVTRIPRLLSRCQGASPMSASPFFSTSRLSSTRLKGAAGSLILPRNNRPWTDFTGRFGPRTIRLETGKLVHQRDGRPRLSLVSGRRPVRNAGNP